MFLLSTGWTMTIIWFSIILVAAIIEASTMDLSSIWFSAGGLVALIIAIIWPELIALQIIVFILISSGLLLGVRPIFKRTLQKNDIKTNADKLVGKVAVCTKAFKPEDRGEVKIDGKIWTAISHEAIALNDKVEVLAIDGVKLVVKKKAE